MPKFAANLSMLFSEHAFLDRFAAAAAAGFSAVEFLFPYDHKPDVIKQRLADNNLELVLFNLSPGDWQAGMRGLTALKGRETEFQAALRNAIKYARVLGCRQLHAMAGLIPQGADNETYITNLKTACAWAAPYDISILIEPINTSDMPGYFLSEPGRAADVIKAVGADNLGLQFDLYHRAKMHSDVLAEIAEYVSLTRHYQCAAPRDRGEPDRQDLDYQAVFQTIDASGFDGWIGCEYRPRGRSEDGLVWRQDLVS